MRKALRNHINRGEILNAVQERKRCNRHAIISWWNTIPFQELISGAVQMSPLRGDGRCYLSLKITSPFTITFP